MDLTNEFGGRMHVRDAEEYDDDDDDEDEEASGSDDIAIEEDTEEEKAVSTTETPGKAELKNTQIEQKGETKETVLAEQLKESALDASDVNTTSKTANTSAGNLCNTTDSVNIIVLLLINLLICYHRFC